MEHVENEIQEMIPRSSYESIASTRKSCAFGTINLQTLQGNQTNSGASKKFCYTYTKRNRNVERQTFDSRRQW